MSRTSNPSIPVNTVGIAALSLFPTNSVYPVLLSCQTNPDPGLPFLNLQLLGWKGTKTAWGFTPLSPGDSILVNATLITPQAGSPAETASVGVAITFVIANSRPGQNFPQPIPFQADNGQSNVEGVTITQTSAANTAQTLDIAPIQGVEYEITQAWGYTSAGAIAATMNVYDGTTAVAIASPASGTTFDLTPATRRSIVGGTGTIMFRASAPAAGVGNTSTLYISFLARSTK